jgi:hypothetical protein
MLKTKDNIQTLYKAARNAYNNKSQSAYVLNNLLETKNLDLYGAAAELFRSDRITEYARTQLAEYIKFCKNQILPVAVQNGDVVTVRRMITTENISNYSNELVLLAYINKQEAVLKLLLGDGRINMIEAVRTCVREESFVSEAHQIGIIKILSTGLAIGFGLIGLAIYMVYKN